MAQVKASADFRSKLKRVLREDLAKVGIRALVTIEDVPGTRLNRVMVIAKELAKVSHSERQDLLWRIIGQHFSPDERLLISMVVALDSLEAKELLHEQWTRLSKALGKLARRKTPAHAGR